MDTTKVIVTLLILTIVLSIATVAFTAFSGNNVTIRNERGNADRATVGIYVEDPNIGPATGGSNVGLYVEDSE